MQVSHLAKKFVAIKTELSKTLSSVALAGQLDEFADFSDLSLDASRKIIFNFKNVIRINSIGLQKWIHFLSKLPAEMQYEFADCPISIVNQINMFKGFLGRPETAITSFEVPYFCESCNKPESKMINAADIFGSNSEIEIPEVICPACGNKFSFDGVERKYFAFLLRE